MINETASSKDYLFDHEAPRSGGPQCLKANETGQHHRSGCGGPGRCTDPVGRRGVSANGTSADDDREAAVILLSMALVEIRYLAGSMRRETGEATPEEDLDRIRFLANLVHNLPRVTQPPVHRPSRRNVPPKARERAMLERPMSYTWNTAGPKGRAWITARLDRADRPWTPPPLPTAPTSPPVLTWGQRLALPGRWPVQPPDGLPPLPQHAHVLKELESEAVLDLFAEAGRLRLGLGTGGAWLRAHLAKDGTHYLVPDPASYYWPGNSDGACGKIRWWQCTALLQMSDGAQVTSMVAVLPETFTALPSTLPRRKQRRLLHLARATSRGTYLWGRDHKADCGPTTCGFTPDEATEPVGPDPS
jgi:hypothetical protein